MSERITLEDSSMSAIMKMADGNPGAINALMEIFNNTHEIDPQGFARGLGPILSLDSLGIYGTGIYILWSDKCNGDTRKLVMLLRAWQLGFFDKKRLQELAADQTNCEIITADEWRQIEDVILAKLKDFKR